MRRTLFIVSCVAILETCSPPPPTAITFEIAPASTCRGNGPEIRSVLLRIIGARKGVECFEDAQCVGLSAPYPRLINEVQPALPRTLTFDLVAKRGYQFEAIGFGTTDCTLGSSFGNYRFCGQSDPVRLDTDQNVRITAECGVSVPECAGRNTSLRYCM